MNNSAFRDVSETDVTVKQNNILMSILYATFVFQMSRKVVLATYKQGRHGKSSNADVTFSDVVSGVTKALFSCSVQYDI